MKRVLMILLSVLLLAGCAGKKAQEAVREMPQAAEEVQADNPVTAASTEAPTEAPTEVPTEVPTEEPTEAPTPEPTPEPTATPEPTSTPLPEPNGTVFYSPVTVKNYYIVVNDPTWTAQADDGSLTLSDPADESKLSNILFSRENLQLPVSTEMLDFALQMLVEGISESAGKEAAAFGDPHDESVNGFAGRACEGKITTEEKSVSVRAVVWGSDTYAYFLAATAGEGSEEKVGAILRGMLDSFCTAEAYDALVAEGKAPALEGPAEEPEPQAQAAAEFNSEKYDFYFAVSDPNWSMTDSANGAVFKNSSHKYQTQILVSSFATDETKTAEQLDEDLDAVKAAVAESLGDAELTQVERTDYTVNGNAGRREALQTEMLGIRVEILMITWMADGHQYILGLTSYGDEYLESVKTVDEMLDSFEPARAEQPEQQPEQQPAGQPEQGTTVSGLDNVVLMDAQGVKITATGLDEAGWGGPKVKLLIENTSGKDLTVQTRNSSVNGYVIDTLMSARVANGKKVNDGFTIDSDDLKMSGIETIYDIELSFHVFTSEDYNTYYDSEMIRVETGAEGTQVRDDSGEVLYEGEGFKIVSKGAVELPYSGPALRVYLENNTGHAVTVHLENVSVNGFMISPAFYEEMQDGKCAVKDISFFKSDLDANGIEKIEEIEFSFELWELATYKTILAGGPIKAAF